MRGGIQISIRGSEKGTKMKNMLDEKYCRGKSRKRIDTQTIQSTRAKESTQKNIQRYLQENLTQFLWISLCTTLFQVSLGRPLFLLIFMVAFHTLLTCLPFFILRRCPYHRNCFSCRKFNNSCNCSSYRMSYFCFSLLPSVNISSKNCSKHYHFLFAWYFSFADEPFSHCFQ